LEGELLGRQKNSNSIGFMRNGLIYIEGSSITIGNGNGFFKKGDFAGLGIIRHPNSKMECFATLNGILLGKIINLEIKFIK